MCTTNRILFMKLDFGRSLWIKKTLYLLLLFIIIIKSFKLSNLTLDRKIKISPSC